MLRSVAFDMDGTLGDTLPLCIESFRRAVRDLDGRELADAEISALFGPSDLGVIQRLFPGRPDLVWPGMERMYHHYCELHDEMAPGPFPGAVELLEKLLEGGLILAVVTGKCIETARYTIRKFGMERFFPMVEAGSPRKVIKGECLLRIADHYALQPSEMIYVGDTAGDIRACREAGVKILSAAWQNGSDRVELEKLNPGNVFDRLEDCGYCLLSEAAIVPL